MDIENIIIECLDGLEEEGDAALEAVCARYPEQAAEIRRRVQSLRDVGLLADAGEADHSIPERLGDYQLLRSLGVGGMGVVYLARQISLGREVALKLIRPELLFFPGSRERFRREVQTIAVLQHPGIVPVYAVGEESGIPYFAMERVHGCTLAEALELLHGKDPACMSGSDLALAVTACIPEDSPDAGAAAESKVFEGSFADVCVRLVQQGAEALEYAHRHGILHRDIKPSNFMVTRSGRVMLLDFGLASRGETRLTRSGAQLGSLAYMAPEQVEGELSDLDTRADVYSLGVTLYELLTLSSPFEGRSTEQTRQRILQGHPPAPRRHNPSLSWDIETVCLKAMERSRERRYASAADFARDLGNVLGRRSIEARRPRLGLRLWRWSQRHPAGMVALVAGVLMLVGGPVVFGVQQRRARLGLQEAYQQVQEENVKVLAERTRAEEQRERAERNFGWALQAVQRLLTRVGRESLENVPQVQIIRREILEDALEFYAEFLKEREDSLLQREVAEVKLTLGALLRWLGRPGEAEAQFAEQRRLLGALCEQSPGEKNFRLRWQIAASLALSAAVHVDSGRIAAAEATYREALSRYAELEAAGFEDLAFASDRASTRVSLGFVLFQTGRLEEAEVELKQALEVLAAARESGGEGADLLANAASAWNQLAIVHRGLRRDAEAEHDHRQAMALRERLVASGSADPSLRYDLAESQVNLGFLLEGEGRSREAEALLRAAVETYAGLVEDYPEIPQYLYGAFAAALNLSNSLFAIENLAEADGFLAQALAMARRLYRLRPDAPDHVNALSVALGNWAEIRSERGDLDEALEAAEEALALADENLRRNPNNPGFLYQRASVQLQLAGVLLAQGLADDAVGILATLPAPGFTQDRLVLREALRKLSRCAEIALADVERPDRVTDVAELAADLLEGLASTGWRDFDGLEDDPELGVLLEQEDFEEAVLRLRGRSGK